MAKRFAAPIQIKHPAIAQARQGPRSSDARGILQEIAELGDVSSVYEGKLEEWLKLGEEPAKIAYTNLFTASAVGVMLADVANGYRAIALSTDPLEVDDYSLLTFSSPPTLGDLAALLRRVEQAQAVRKGGDSILTEVEEWMTHKSPIRNRQEVVDSVLASGKLGAPCFHLRPHDRLSKRGRKTSVPIRIRDWGTYIFSWLVGSETLAVRLWNRLFLPSEFRWVPKAYSETAEGLDYAVKKYSDAKRRLAKDIIDRYDYVNPMTFQGLPPVTPPPPLSLDTANLLLLVFEKKLHEDINVIFGRVFRASGVEALILPLTTTT